MEIITIGFIVILNLVAITILYRSLGNIEIKNKIAITIIGILLMYIILYVIYNISSKGIESAVVQASRQMIIFAFLPINLICIATPILMQIRKLKEKDLTNEKFKKKIIIYFIIAIVILVIECIYIKDIQTGIAKFEG